jgi:hypothetical protein
VLQEGADDCVISGLTVYNNYGTAVENTTIHQMAIFGRATRTIIINSNVWADGNDALSLWAPGSNGMYYHADLYLRCPGVDFLIAQQPTAQGYSGVESLCNHLIFKKEVKQCNYMPITLLAVENVDFYLDAHKK